MLKTKVVNFSNKILEYGYTYENKKECQYTLEKIVKSVHSSLIVFDSNDLIIDALIASSYDLLNDNAKVFIGLVNENKLIDIHNKNLLGGFFRSTKEKTNAAIIIVDKTLYYAAFSKDVIFYLGTSNNYKELFGLINHYIWAKSTAELCKGQFKNVNETRLSVPYPTLTTAKEYPQTNDYNNKNGYILTDKYGKYQNPTLITKANLYQSFLKDSTIELNIFGNYFYEVEYDDSYIKARSFSSQTIGELYSSGNRIVWYDGKDINILENDSLKNTVYQPVDTYRDYNPDYESYLRDYNGIALNLTISIDIVPIIIDSTYKLSPKYEKIKQYNQQLESGIATIKMLFKGDKKLEKQIETIEQERNIYEKAELFNRFISNNQAGVTSLNNKKNNFKSIIINKDDLVVPNEIIGKLYEKNNQEYLAIKSESDIQKGKEWLRDNKYLATLVLLNG